MSARPATTHFSRRTVVMFTRFLRTGGRRQQDGRHPTETGNLLSKDIILACSASAIIQLLLKCPPAGSRCRCEADQRLISLGSALHEPPPTALDSLQSGPEYMQVHQAYCIADRADSLVLFSLDGVSSSLRYPLLGAGQDAFSTAWPSSCEHIQLGRLNVIVGCLHNTVSS